MSTVAGEVQAISHKFGKTSILVNDTWYGSKFGITPLPNKGDGVEFEDGGGKFVNKLKIVTPGSGGSPTPSTGGATVGATSRVGFPVPIDTKDRSIVRQNSLGHATSLVTTMLGQISELEFDSWADREEFSTTHANLIVSIARIFEDYSCGDSDFEEAKRSLEEGE